MEELEKLEAGEITLDDIKLSPYQRVVMEILMEGPCTVHEINSRVPREFREFNSNKAASCCRTLVKRGLAKRKNGPVPPGRKRSKKPIIHYLFDCQIEGVEPLDIPKNTPIFSGRWK